MSSVNSEFQQLDVVRDFEPTLELVDGIVNDLYIEHGKIDQDETPWMLPLAARGYPRPDSLPHTKIEQCSVGWRLTRVQRALGEGALGQSYHIGTKVSRYQRTQDDLFIDEFTFFRDGYWPKVSIFPDNNRRGEYTRELFTYLFNKVLIPKRDILEDTLAERAVQTGTERDRSLLQNGGRWMRRKERQYLGHIPDLSDY